LFHPSLDYFNEHLNPAYLTIVYFGNAYDEEQAGCISEASNDVKEGAALLAMNFLGPEAGEGAAEAAEDLPFAENSLTHIFQVKDGHMPVDTPANRAILQNGVRNGVKVGTNEFGMSTYRQLLPDGTQTWVQVYKGAIKDGGINQIPR
jgi:hypothetical protein